MKLEELQVPISSNKTKIELKDVHYVDKDEGLRWGCILLLV
ncbi:hypothetical protein [Thermococcus chitonophagus]|uniref:Uncharacterized protein n=1 Tax=Thermococcus chitonophagus TaxID=54262 RepID=A0A170SK79_9EURY|nr:hypothetical protein CHITON_1029 [Thermococcus chitonophagus]